MENDSWSRLFGKLESLKGAGKPKNDAVVAGLIAVIVAAGSLSAYVIHRRSGGEYDSRVSASKDFEASSGLFGRRRDVMQDRILLKNSPGSLETSAAGGPVGVPELPQGQAPGRSASEGPAEDVPPQLAVQGGSTANSDFAAIGGARGTETAEAGASGPASERASGGGGNLAAARAVDRRVMTAAGADRSGFAGGSPATSYLSGAQRGAGARNNYAPAGSDRVYSGGSAPGGAGQGAPGGNITVGPGSPQTGGGTGAQQAPAGGGVGAATMQAPEIGAGHAVEGKTGGKTDGKTEGKSEKEAAEEEKKKSSSRHRGKK